ncbi:hypothetical protein ACFSKL_10560 [Belliella marina]|uniref:XRE family transcriptional regulator n=1 Tax=Belliella marina TaxID=1644146 RepID=A0ABW4VR44_9BACT
MNIDKKNVGISAGQSIRKMGEALLLEPKSFTKAIGTSASTIFRIEKLGVVFIM